MKIESVSIPKASPDPLPELEAYLAPFAPLFRRQTSRRSLEQYVTGLLIDLNRKNCDTIAASVASANIERLQYLLTDAEWDAVALNKQRVEQLVERSPKAGILLLDDTGFPKQGKSSVGVQRQYSGTLGKTANCQIVVSAEYVADEPKSSTPMHWPVSGRLYLPRSWAEDPKRCEQAHLPKEVTFKTKLEIAISLLDQARDWKVPFAFVVADAGYGTNYSFLEQLEERQLKYVCGVESNFGVRMPEEVQAAESHPDQGIVWPGCRYAPLHTAAEVIAAMPDDAWIAVCWREGTKKQLAKQFVAVRVHRATGNPDSNGFKRSEYRTGPEGWLLAERPVSGEEGEQKFYYSNLPSDTSLARLVELAHSRWAIEQFYEDAKGECGLDDYQGRRWDGLHRHIALVMLTYSFLSQQRESEPEHLEGDFSPLGNAENLSRRTPTSGRMAITRPRAMVHRNRPNQNVSSASKLTK